jgi:hypothetical protein
MTQVCSEPRMPGVYLIHIENGDHYIGWAEDVDARIEAHEKTICYPPDPTNGETVWKRIGHGAKFLGVMNYRKLYWEMVRPWWGKGRDWERRLKAQHKSKDFCPVCSGPAAYNRMKG